MTPVRSSLCTFVVILRALLPTCQPLPQSHSPRMRQSATRALTCVRRKPCKSRHRRGTQRAEADKYGQEASFAVFLRLARPPADRVSGKVTVRAPDLALDLVLEPGKGAAIKKSWPARRAASRRGSASPPLPPRGYRMCRRRVVLAVAACTSPLSSCQQRCGRLLVLPLTATISCMRSATGEAARAGCSPANDLAHH